MSDHIKVLTNQTLVIGGSPDFHLLKNSSGYVDFEGSDSLPICFSFSPSVPVGCFQVGKRVFNTDNPTLDNTKPDGKGNGRRMWELWMTTVGDKEEKRQHYTTAKNLPPRYPLAEQHLKRTPFGREMRMLSRAGFHVPSLTMG